MAFRALSKSSNLRFSDRAYDVRGWQVRTMADAEEAGEIDDIIVDETGVPRYLDIDLGLFQKHVLLPIGQARVDAKDEVVWVPGMTRDQFGEIPEYDHDLSTLSREYEDRLVGAYGATAGSSTYTAGAASGRLAGLDEFDDLEVAEGDPDIRGWELLGADGRRLGEVDELIVDASAMKVRYVSVDLDDDLTETGEDRHVLIPIGLARLDEDGEKVFLDALDASEIAALPEFTGEASREYEEHLTSALTTDSERFHAHPRYDAGTFYGPRNLNTDEARITLSEEDLATGTGEDRD